LVFFMIVDNVLAYTLSGAGWKACTTLRA